MQAKLLFHTGFISLFLAFFPLQAQLKIVEFSVQDGIILKENRDESPYFSCSSSEDSFSGESSSDEEENDENNFQENLKFQCYCRQEALKAYNKGNKSNALIFFESLKDLNSKFLNVQDYGPYYDCMIAENDSDSKEIIYFRGFFLNRFRKTLSQQWEKAINFLYKKGYINEVQSIRNFHPLEKKEQGKKGEGFFPRRLH